MKAMHEICTTPNCFLTGANGSGKGYVTKYLLPLLGIRFSVVSLSDRLKSSNLSEEEIVNMEQGRKVSDPYIHELLFEIIEEHRDLEGENSLLVIDGYPRGPEQAEFLFQNFCKEFTSLIVVDASRETCYKACLDRGRHDDCQEKFERRWIDWEKDFLPAAKRASEDFPSFWIPGGKQVPDQIKLNPLIRMAQKMGFFPQVAEFDLEKLFPAEEVASWIAYGELRYLEEEILDFDFEEEELLVNV